MRKVCEVLQSRHRVRVHGFYTQEVRGVRDRQEVPMERGRGPRTGFDVVTFGGKQGPLARLKG